MFFETVPNPRSNPHICYDLQSNRGLKQLSFSAHLRQTFEKKFDHSFAKKVDFRESCGCNHCFNVSYESKERGLGKVRKKKRDNRARTEAELVGAVPIIHSGSQKGKRTSGAPRP